MKSLSHWVLAICCCGLLGPMMAAIAASVGFSEWIRGNSGVIELALVGYTAGAIGAFLFILAKLVAISRGSTLTSDGKDRTSVLSLLVVGAVFIVSLPFTRWFIIEFVANP
jgi:hypothetical protein